MNWLLRILGIAPKTVDSVLADAQKVINDLEVVAQKHTQDAEDTDNVIAEHQAKIADLKRTQEFANNERARAIRVANNFKNLLGVESHE
jgi:uncharacterized protein YgfB (UPF0149 family)